MHGMATAVLGRTCRKPQESVRKESKYSKMSRVRANKQRVHEEIGIRGKKG